MAIKMNLLMDTHPEIYKELVSPDPRLTTGSGKKVTWKCGLGHTWDAAVYHRARGTGCPFCSGQRVWEGFNDLKTVIPELYSELVNKNLLLSVGSTKPVEWTCVRHHTWTASTNNRFKGNGCPYCANKKVLSGFNDLKTISPELFGQLLEKSLLLTKSSGKRVMWECDQGHRWEATPASRTNGQGCPYCSNRRVLPQYNDIKTTHPYLFEQLVDKTLLLTRGSSRKVFWQCILKHQWRATVADRVRGFGCPYCTNQKVMPGFNDVATTHPELYKQMLNKEMLTAGSNKKVQWRCDRGHEWTATVSSRKFGNGCPDCTLWGTSKMEIAFADAIESEGVKICRNDRTVIDPLELDIYRPCNKTAIEFNGEYWHSLPGAKERDARKRRACEVTGIELLVVNSLDYISDPDKVVKQAVEFLSQEKK